jgi:hypothetical protein
MSVLLDQIMCRINQNDPYEKIVSKVEKLHLCVDYFCILYLKLWTGLN